MTYFPQTIYVDLTDLTTVHADNYKLCCPATLPEGFNLFNCHAPSDEVSSCGDLLQSGVYRVFVAVSAFLILVGNLTSFVCRVIIKGGENKSSFEIIVSSLSVSDFLIGIYSGVTAGTWVRTCGMTSHGETVLCAKLLDSSPCCPQRCGPSFSASLHWIVSWSPVFP